MKDKNLEIRNLQHIELRKNEDDTYSRTIQGYAVRFNEESENLGFYETIMPESISQETLDKSDIFALLNHDESKILARSKNGVGSLKLELREDGLFYSFESPKTAIGDELLEHIKRGEITGSSFAMVVDAGGDKWEKRDGNYYRTITKIAQLYDVSPVYQPAYSTTTAEARSKEKMEELDAKIMAELDAKAKEIDDLCANLPLSE